MALTKEQRAAKFASNKAKEAPGLRSRGHRKLTKLEQKQLLSELTDQPTETRLHNLRILREAVRSSESPDICLERAIYERSAEEYILIKQFENVVHVLGHLCSIDGVAPRWKSLYVIALANAKQFHNAFQQCREVQDQNYVRSVLNMDIPLWNVLIDKQADNTSKILMSQFLPEIENYNKRLETAFRHPAQAKQATLKSTPHINT